MIVCWCNHCPFSCGKTFETADEYRKFCYEKFVSRYPNDRILCSKPTSEEKKEEIHESAG